MNIDYIKFEQQLILVSNIFLRLVDEHKEKVHVCYPSDKAVSEMIKGLLTG